MTHGTLTFAPGSLVILDVQELPAVCGVWPAIWMNGDGVWPASGEIDILEGVNMYTQNVMSVHTNEGCYLDQSLLSALRGVTLKVKDQLSCDANANPETCGFNVDDDTSYGPPFNSQGGGTLAVSLETSGVHFYYWKQGKVPQDIYNNTPTPSKWGDALISVISPSCKIEDHFKDMRIVVNINLAGTFTSGVWSYPGNGQEKACSEITGFDNPWDYVTQKGSEFKDAKFVCFPLWLYSCLCLTTLHRPFAPSRHSTRVATKGHDDLLVCNRFYLSIYVTVYTLRLG